MLTGARILILEDEPYIALALAACIEDAGGEVVGPAASVEEALPLLDDGPLSGAIVDVRLVGPDMMAMAETLIEAGVPVVVQSGVGLPDHFEARYPALPILAKPVHPEHVVQHLARCFRGELTCNHHGGVLPGPRGQASLGGSAGQSSVSAEQSSCWSGQRG